MNTIPSKTTSDYWVFAEAPNQGDQTNRVGKWMLFPLKENMDAVWLKIAKATEDGQLGISSKASTAKATPSGSNSKAGLICVYTYDADDVSDVKRVLAQLRALGFNGRLNYKEDEQTLLGNYAGDNSGGVSLFTSPPESLEVVHPKKWSGRRLV